MTRRPLRRSTAATRSRPSNAAPSRAIRARTGSSDMRPSGTPARSAERASAPAGAAPRRTAAVTGAIVLRSMRPRRACGTSRGPAAASFDAAPAGPPDRSGGTPAASLAATIAPAEVPTKHRASRNSIPVLAAAPARNPDIHASPSTPPTPNTSTSGVASASIGPEYTRPDGSGLRATGQGNILHGNP